MKNQIEALRIKTRMSEAFSATKLPYPKQAEVAKQQLSALQEQYRQLTGDYAKEYMLNEDGPNGLRCIMHNGQKYVDVVDLATKIFGGEMTFDDFKEWLSHSSNAGS